MSDADTLLVLDEDTRDEEPQHLVLLRDNRVLDRIGIGTTYVTGSFRPSDVSAGTLHFCFENNSIRTLAVDTEGRRGIGGLPSGARRQTGLLALRCMALARLPLPSGPMREDRPESMDLIAGTNLRRWT